MKKVIMFFYDLAVAVAGGVVVEPTSQKLTELKAEKNRIWLEGKKIVANATAPDSKEELDNKAEAYKIDAAIKAEIANIRTQEREQAAAMARAEQVKLNETQLEAYKALLNVAPKATDEVKNALNEAFTKAKEAVENQLIGGRKVTVATGNGEVKIPGTKGEKTQQILAIITPMYAGVTKETAAEVGKAARHEVIKVQGFNDGTANDAILTYEKSLGLK